MRRILLKASENQDDTIARMSSRVVWNCMGFLLSLLNLFLVGFDFGHSLFPQSSYCLCPGARFACNLCLDITLAYFLII
jgi:hypothetical protein